MVNHVPNTVFDPWQIPKTWGELRSICNQNNIDLDSHLKKLFLEIRDGKHHLLLLGLQYRKTMEKSHISFIGRL